jgi:hypothetical protein
LQNAKFAKWRRNNEKNTTGFCMSPVISRFKDNIAVRRTLSGSGKDPVLSKTILAGDEND